MPKVWPKTWIDAHCHLSDPRLGPVIGQFLKRAREAGIRRFIQGGVSPEDWLRQRALADSEEGIFCSFGLHPWWVASHTPDEFQTALESLGEWLPGAIALGELGLDYGKRCPDESRPLQKEAFERQL